MADQPKFLIEVDTLIRARYPLLYLVTYEEQRVDALLGDLCRTQNRQLLEWTATRGLRGLSAPLHGVKPEETREPLAALMQLSRLKAPALVLLKDFHRHLEDPVVARAMRELALALKATQTTVVIVAPRLTLPDDLEKDVSVIDVPLPDRADLMKLLRDIARVVTRNKRARVELTGPQAESLVSAVHGLTLVEAENAFARAIARDDKLDGDDLKLLLDEKSQVVRKSGVLEYFATDQSLKDVGGLQNLKHWLERRSKAFSEAARSFGLPEPRGLLLLGVQGLWQEPHRQGHRHQLAHAAGAPRHGPHLQRPRRLVRREPAQGHSGRGKPRPRGAVGR
jgi:hypothetical protein